jgi:hypothetical protein
MPDLKGDEWVAVATFALALVTLLLVIETTLARRDATSVANVVARITMSRGGDITDAVYLDTFGPAVASQIELALRYVNRDGSEVAPARVLKVPAMAPGDHVPIMPSLMLPAGEPGMHPELDDLARLGYSLELEWSWLDGRRSLIAPRVRPRHRTRQITDLVEYRDLVHRGIVFLEPDVFTAVRDLEQELGRRARNAEIRANLGRRPDHPVIQVLEEFARLRYAREVWRERIKYVASRLRSRVTRASPREK